ncbi:protein tramtrack, alpha isoform-like isoform X6 [Eriocheir sinensis]|uniref:protein tramtrack, alpha isoform-like isoform X6 n=1 Tax=Eriocheir sinensis TaxID=95602 RepID=UPI0021C797D9|nr:protein tramtrack, alpha isoform-like isoform X6 [Eriocheir sinensis]
MLREGEKRDEEREEGEGCCWEGRGGKTSRRKPRQDVIMEDGLLSLKWNNHKTTFFDILRVLREKANYTDATIAVEGKFYPVHKLVMSTCSEYFSEIFERTPCKSPVIVLKDVRSQDMDALLDYMYLGEVNVNQNDLASLLKTAECLRIKGLAVPDEDPTKSKKQHLQDDRRESPPPKRRRHEDSSSSTSQTLRPVSPPPASSPVKNSSTSGPGAGAGPGGPQHTSTGQGQDSSHDSIDPPPMVKVEMEEADDLEDGYRRDNNYEGGSINEGDTGDYGSEVSKSEHDPENYGSGSYAGPSLQQGGDHPWEEGDSSSFPPEGFAGDLPSGQQPQGGWENVRPGALIPVVEIRHPPSASSPTSLASLISGNTSMCAATPVAPSGSAFSPYSSSGTPRGSTPDLGQVAPSDKQAFMCPVCGKQFGQPYNLRRHLTTHTGERPYRCPHCNYAASQNVHLEKHIRRIHLNLQNSQSAGTHPAGPAHTWAVSEPTSLTP